MTLLEQLQQLAPLAAHATAGPWIDHCAATGNNAPFAPDDEVAISSASAPADAAPIERVVVGIGYYDGVRIACSREDAAFIAAARNLLTPENLTLLVAALAPKWLPVADLPSKLHEEFLYVLLPTGTVAQAMYTDFFTNDLEGVAWCEYIDIDCLEPLPVQPTHFFSPPIAPTR